MDRTRADYIIEQYSKLLPLRANEAAALASKVFASWPADRNEAEQLLSACTRFGDNDLAWRAIITQEVTRHLLDTDDTPGALPGGAEDWLIANLTTMREPVNAVAMDIIQSIMRLATNPSERLGRVGLRAAMQCLKTAAPTVEAYQVNTA